MLQLQTNSISKMKKHPHIFDINSYFPLLLTRNLKINSLVISRKVFFRLSVSLVILPVNSLLFLCYLLLTGKIKFIAKIKTKTSNYLYNSTLL